MFGVETQRVMCPYCGESFELVVDCSVEQQTYTEDCEVCCRPIVFSVSVDEQGSVSISARDENEC